MGPSEVLIHVFGSGDGVVAASGCRYYMKLLHWGKAGAGARIPTGRTMYPARSADRGFQKWKVHSFLTLMNQLPMKLAVDYD
jgi:hypothetical protein